MDMKFEFCHNFICGGRSNRCLCEMLTIKLKNGWKWH